jgi:hypothetical protein
MNFIKTLAMVGLVLVSTTRISCGADNSSEKFLQAFQLFQKAEKEERSGNNISSLQDYQKAEQLLMEISSSDPSFQRSVVEYRLKKAKAGITRLSSTSTVVADHDDRPPSIPAGQWIAINTKAGLALKMQNNNDDSIAAELYIKTSKGWKRCRVENPATSFQ